MIDYNKPHRLEVRIKYTKIAKFSKTAENWHGRLTTFQRQKWGFLLFLEHVDILSPQDLPLFPCSVSGAVFRQLPWWTPASFRASPLTLLRPQHIHPQASPSSCVILWSPLIICFIYLFVAYLFPSPSQWNINSWKGGFFKSTFYFFLFLIFN